MLPAHRIAHQVAPHRVAAHEVTRPWSRYEAAGHGHGQHAQTA